MTDLIEDYEDLCYMYPSLAKELKVEPYVWSSMYDDRRLAKIALGEVEDLEHLESIINKFGAVQIKNFGEFQVLKFLNIREEHI